MRVKELVQIEEIEEVVKITSHDPAKIVESFVASENLEDQICFLLERFLKRREKNSFFIIGSYGSGKSHLLSFLGDLFAYPNLWDKVKSEKIRSYAPQFREKCFIPIWIHLPSMEVDLRDYVLLELEKQLSKQLEKPIYLAPDIYIQKAEEDPRFENFLRENLDRENPIEAWNYKKSNHPEEALELSRKFFNELGIRPMIDEDVSAVMDKALNILYRELGTGVAIVLIIDELYDFLRGKGSNTPSFARDIGFLRELGEASTNYNFFVIASLQEDILDPEKTGAERENLNRIRQRYENLQIPYFNLQKVARERVLRKNDWQVEELRKLYSRFRERYFPSLEFDEASFVDLYPIHPAVLYFYERVVREVGPRSIISFLSKSALAIQDEPHDRLVTIAELFDHLRDELSTHTTFGVLIRDVFPYFQKHIPQWIVEEEQEWAEKAIKALLILHIVDERRTCQQLAELILYRGTEEINYQFFAQLMKKLHEKGSPYLYLAEGSGVNAIYVIRKEGEDVDILISNEASRIKDDDTRILNEILMRLKEDKGAPRELELGKWCTVNVDWKNTERKGKTIFLTREEKESILEEANAELNDIENDFVLLVLSPNLPRDFLTPSELPDERILIWRPGELGIEELEILKRRLAILNLLKASHKEEITNELQRRAIASEGDVEKLVEEIYFKLGELSNLSSIKGGFLDAVAESVKVLLDKRFTSHPNFNRRINKKMVRETIRYLAGLIRTPSPTYEDYADTLSSAGLLVKEGDQTYRVKEEAEPYKVIMNKLKRERYCKISDIYKELRDKPYGLTEEVAEFLILSLVKEGLASVKSLDTPQEFFRQDLKELMGIDLISPRHFLHLLEIPITPEVLAFLKEIYGDVEPKTQEEKMELWEQLRERREEFDLKKLEETLNYFHPPFNKDVLISKLDNLRRNIEPLFNILSEHPSPEEGFQKLGEFLKEDYKSQIENWRSLKSLKEITDLQEEINREIDYLQQVSLPRGDELLTRRDTLLAELQRKEVGDIDFLKKWLDRTSSFKKNYIERYTALHEEMVGNSASWWGKIKRLRSSEKLRTLRDLWEIRGEVGASNPAQQIIDSLFGLEKLRCGSLFKDSLRNNPLCPACHFHPDEPPDLERKLSELEGRLEEEWNSIIEELNRDKEKIEEQRQKATSEASEGIERLLQGEPVQLSGEMKEVLLRALGKLDIKEVDLRPYLKDGGIYKPHDLLERIRRAIDEAVKGRKDDNIRIRLRLS